LFLQEEWAINKNWSVLYGGRLTRAQSESAGPFAYQDSSGEAQTGEASAIQWVTHQMFFLLWKPSYFTSYRLAGSYGLIPALSHFVQPFSDSLRMFVPSSSPNSERCWNVSFDLRRVSRLADWGWTNDISFFVTGLDHHLDVYAAESQSELRPGSPYLIPGAELFSRLDIGEDAAILLGYTFLYPNDAYETSPGTMLPLPHHQANFELDWEIEGTGVRLELESKFVSGQKTPGNLFRSSAPPYEVLGATLECSLGPAKLFGGVENAADFRQSDNGPLWGPRQGREFYLGLKALL
jgi:outer membrane receptor protein involved in Fe transport